MWLHSTWWRGSCNVVRNMWPRCDVAELWHGQKHLQHTDYYYVYILVFDERGHFLIKYKIELDMIFMNNIIKHDTITYYLYDYYTLILFVCWFIHECGKVHRGFSTLWIVISDRTKMKWLRHRWNEWVAPSNNCVRALGLVAQHDAESHSRR